MQSNIFLFPYFYVTASSTAVLVQLTPLLGALVGVVATLFLVAVCIVIFVKFRSKVNIFSFVLFYDASKLLRLSYMVYVCIDAI